MTKNELIEENLGRNCIVLSRHNHFLFQGKLTGFHSGAQQIELTWNQFSPPPWGSIAPDRRLKLIVRESGTSSHLVVIEGCVARVMKENLIMDLETAFLKEESRDSYRQAVMKSCLIRVPEDEKSSQICTVVDISASGVGLIAREQYEVDQELELRDLRLCSGRPIHSVTCVVRHKREVAGKGYFYGCQFSDLTVDQEDALYCDIFAMQADELRRKREH